MMVSQLMSRDVVKVSMDDTLAEIKLIFEEHRFHHVMVTENGQIVGVISDRDLLKNISPFMGRLDERNQDLNCLRRRAHQIMTRKLVCTAEDVSPREAMQIMLREHISCLPVVDGRRRCVGVVSWRDLMSYAVGMLGSDLEPLPQTEEAA